jgi:16S rRNA (uracil1498-N3)-methyltransferase
MPADRFFIASPLPLGQEVILEDSEFHHLIHVMRLKVDEMIELVNGQGSLAHARIKQITKKQALLSIENVHHQLSIGKELILAQAMPRINRLDFIIEKGTELGATQFWLFPGSHSERKMLTEHQLERFENLSIASMKQCGRLFLPKIEVKPALEKWKKLDMPSYFGDVRETAPSFHKALKRSESALFFIGPEAGFNDKEVELLLKLGAEGVKLHDNILRTDTAALVALCLMST